VLAGPLACQILGDYGADVIKVEHPRGDALRGHGLQVDGEGLWWKMVSRNKRCLALYLGDPAGADVFRRLVADADVVVENFRPGTFERWGLAPDELLAINPRLVMCRVTGFGQDGPYADRPAFGTLVEAMSGFASMTGEPDGPPTLPPFGLADSVAALSAVSAITMALRHSEATGCGQVIDQSILEPLVMALGPHILNYDHTGTVPPRTGNRSTNNAPRNTYVTADGRWVAVSASADSIAQRAVELVGRGDLAENDWFWSGAGRAEHVEEIDAAMAEWIGARPIDEVVEAFAEAEVALAPVYEVDQYLDDPQVRHRGSVVTVDDPQIGQMRMQNVLFQMSETPGSVSHTGRPIGADTDEILAEAGLTIEEITELRSRKVTS
jgi:formyl-CoA transferase